MRKCLLTLCLFSFSQFQLYAQVSHFDKDSLLASENRLKKEIKSLPADFLKSILKADYKKPGWNEYIPKDGIPILDITLPQMNSRPRFFSQQEIENAKSKILTMPYRDWYLKLKREVQRDNLNSSLPVFYFSNRLKMLALLYKIDGDIEYLRKFESLLKAIPEPPQDLNLQGGTQFEGWGEFLESAQAIATLCPAIDLVYDDLNRQLREDIRRKMLIVTGQLQESLLYTPANNHLTVISIAFLEMAIFDDHPEDYIPYNRIELWNSGLRNLSRALGRVAPDGGYAEGTSYAHFVLTYLAPLSLYLKNILAINFMQHPRLERLVNWTIANDKGNNHFTAIDDALQPNDFFMPLLIPGSKQAPFWNYYYQSTPKSNRAYSNMVEAILTYRPVASFLPNHLPKDSFYPESGQAVFKDKSINPDIFGSFIAERERWFSDRHEHIDPLSFELSAYGEDFIVEGGYGQWIGDFDRSTWYTSPYSHNGILIDGLGVYKNPIWGDSSGSQIMDMFYSEKNSSAIMKHKISHVQVERKVFFINRRFFLMIDEFDGSSSHDFSLNLNYEGQFRHVFENQYKISKDNSDLNIIHLSSKPSPPLITHNFGLKTPPIPSQPIKSIQIEHMNVKNGALLTMFYPSLKDRPIEIHQTALNKKATLFEINDFESPGINQVMVNKESEVDNKLWHTDARILIYQDNLHGHKTIFLKDFTFFNHNDIKISSPYPVDLFIEYKDGSWYGYIYEPHENKYSIKIEGYFDPLIRFNRQLVQTDQDKDSSYNINLKGSGIIEIGPTHNRITPVYRFHDESNFLYWLKNRPKLLQNSKYWTDNEKQIFRNQVTRNTISAIDEAAQKKSSDIFGNPMIFRHILNSTGLIQETFADQTYSSVDIAHRFDKSISLADWETRLIEDGTFTEKGLKLRNLNFQAKNSDERGLHYRFRSFFKNQESHSIRLHQNNQNYVFYNHAKNKEDNFQQINANYVNDFLTINPGLLWFQNSDINQFFINTKLQNFSTNFTSFRNRNGTTYYNESVSGYWNRFSFNLQGYQAESDKYLGSFYLKPFSNIGYSQSIKMSKSKDDIWRIPNAHTNISATFSNQYIFLKQNFLGDQSKQFFYYALTKNNSYFNTSFSMENYKPSLIKYAKVNYQNNFRNNIRYNAMIDILQSGWDFQQKVDIPINSNMYIYPIITIDNKFPEKVNSYGSGFSNYNRFPFFSQIRFYEQENIIEWQTSFYNLYLTSYLDLELWLLGIHRDTNLEYFTFQLKNSINTFTQPGLYYSYSKHLGVRWEGFLMFFL
ncbi:MAG: hypothetical protein D8M58_18120 [Calditrichaeota bacterium]|nr:MAG: hypothetical protein DWQ03_11350 [Calditrichota bacterium]MBL1207326.1 hypothetical protein [Calditrichota bacterium]NOG47158.1 hypothetical protein [Calditrichota bacterium]